MSDSLALLVPDHSIARDHWMQCWARDLPAAQLVELGLWDAPHRNSWVNKLNLAIERAQRPVVLVASGLGCVAVAWWAEFERPVQGGPVRAALLIDPPDVDRPGADPRLAGLHSCPRSELPFRSVLVADAARPRAELDTLRGLARDWGSSWLVTDHEEAVDVGAWPAGRKLLGRIAGSPLSG
jgi:predicted alpha/beta hydrolase family esterase